MAEKINASEAAELRRLLKRKYERASYPGKPVPQSEVKARVLKENPDLAKIVTAVRKHTQALEGMGCTARYSSDTLDRSFFLPMPVRRAYDDAIHEQAEADTQAHRNWMSNLQAAYEAAEDAISMARVDGSVEVAAILAAFEQALK